MSGRGRAGREAPPADAVEPGQWLGLLGGGQLGRMFCMAAQRLGYRVAVLDPSRESPAGSVADLHLEADYLDGTALARMASLCRAATTEFENVPAASLDFLARTLRVTPAATSVAIAQDRISEKTFLSGHGFAVTPHAVLREDADVARVTPQLLPGIVKSARLGYDGKGQRCVATPEEVASAFASLGRRPCVLERFVDLAGEISVIVGRSEGGRAQCWPVAENLHRDGILDVSIAPARIEPALRERAAAMAVEVANALDYRGVLCVEMFISAGGDLLVNEIAPRPHNSGHYTIDACVTSQFEQQARILAGLLPGSTRQHTPAAMVNLLGDLWFDDDDTVREPKWRHVLTHPAAKLHLYGKREPRRGRKMGHVTCLGTTLDEAIGTACAIRDALGMPAAKALEAPAAGVPSAMQAIRPD